MSKHNGLVSYTHKTSFVQSLNFQLSYKNILYPHNLTENISSLPYLVYSFFPPLLSSILLSKSVKHVFQLSTPVCGKSLTLDLPHPFPTRTNNHVCVMNLFTETSSGTRPDLLFEASRREARLRIPWAELAGYTYHTHHITSSPRVAASSCPVTHHFLSFPGVITQATVTMAGRSTLGDIF